jgi:ABC-type lipoprotein export system ATPase subunit
MHIIGLLDRPDEGRYRLDGADVASLPAAQVARLRNQKIGFVFQAFHLLPNTSAIENVELPLLYSDRRRLDGLGRQALAAVGLADRAHSRSSELSGGQQQRVAIARALVNDPDLVLADEPTGNLDAASAADIMTLLRGLNASGRTIVLVTHDPSIAAQCRTVVRLASGRVESVS